MRRRSPVTARIALPAAAPVHHVRLAVAVAERGGRVRRDPGRARLVALIYYRAVPSRRATNPVRPPAGSA